MHAHRRSSQRSVSHLVMQSIAAHNTDHVITFGYLVAAVELKFVPKCVNVDVPSNAIYRCRCSKQDGVHVVQEISRHLYVITGCLPFKVWIRITTGGYLFENEFLVIASSLS